MIIAVTSHNGTINSRFGSASTFRFYNIQDGVILSREDRTTETKDHDAKAAFLRNAGAEKLICGNICMDCQRSVGDAGIEILGCVRGDADAAVEAYLTGTLAYETDPAILM